MASPYASINDSLISKPQKRYAYVTFLCDGSDYWKGALALAKSMRHVRSRYPLLVACRKDVPSKLRRTLTSYGCMIREIEDVPPPEGAKTSAYALPYYMLQYTKLRIWEWDDFEKLCYLDADTVALKNRDHLFDLVESEEHIAGVLDCFCEGWSHQPRLGGARFCQVDPARAPWASPDGRAPPKPYINAGFIVLTPSARVFARMEAALRRYPPTPLAEQDFLNDFFGDKIRILPHGNNLLLCNLWNHPGKVDSDAAELVHFSVSGSKPWRFNADAPNLDLPDVQKLVKRWHQIYASEPHDQQAPEQSHGLERASSWGAATMMGHVAQQ